MWEEFCMELGCDRLLPNHTNDENILDFSHRHRRTEQEEDEELISQNKHAQTSVVHFDQNPHCKWLPC